MCRSLRCTEKNLYCIRRDTEIIPNENVKWLHKPEPVLDDMAVVYLSLRASRSDSNNIRMSPSRTGPFTLRMIDRLDSSRNSTRTWQWPRSRFTHSRAWINHKYKSKSQSCTVLSLQCPVVTIHKVQMLHTHTQCFLVQVSWPRTAAQ